MTSFKCAMVFMVFKLIEANFVATSSQVCCYKASVVGYISLIRITLQGPKHTLE